MNSAVRSVVRMGIYLGCKVYFINEGYQVLWIDIRCEIIIMGEFLAGQKIESSSKITEIYLFFVYE